MFAVQSWRLENRLQNDCLGFLSCCHAMRSSSFRENRLQMDLLFSGLGGLSLSSVYLLDNLSQSDLLFSGRGGGFSDSSVCFLFLQMNTANTAAKVIMMRATNETGKATGAEHLNWYISDPFTFKLTVWACSLLRQKIALQVRFLTPSPSVTIKVIVEVVCQVPRDIMISETSLVR